MAVTSKYTTVGWSDRPGKRLGWVLSHRHDGPCSVHILSKCKALHCRWFKQPWWRRCCLCENSLTGPLWQACGGLTTLSPGQLPPWGPRSENGTTSHLSAGTRRMGVIPLPNSLHPTNPRICEIHTMQSSHLSSSLLPLPKVRPTASSLLPASHLAVLHTILRNEAASVPWPTLNTQLPVPWDKAQTPYMASASSPAPFPSLTLSGTPVCLNVLTQNDLAPASLLPLASWSWPPALGLLL